MGTQGGHCPTKLEYCKNVIKQSYRPHIWKDPVLRCKSPYWYDMDSGKDIKGWELLSLRLKSQTLNVGRRHYKMLFL